MTKKHIISMIFTTLIIAGCGAPAASNNYVIPQQINEPQIAEIIPTFETQIERVNNCDGTNSTYNIGYKTIQTQKAAFEVTVGAGGLVTGTPIPSVLEVQLEAKITAALAKDYGLTTERAHDIKLDNPQGTYLEHTIEWKVTRVKGLIEVIYGDGTAQVVFDKIANVELFNRTSKPLSCDGNSVSVPPTSISPIETLITSLETQPAIQDNTAVLDTQAELNALLGPGNWFCYPDNENEIGIRNIPANFEVRYPLYGVEKDGVLYDIGETVSNSGSQSGTGYLQAHLPYNQCPNQIPNPDSQLPITQDTIDAVLGVGNWSCFSDRYDGVRVKNVPTNFVVKAPLSNVDKGEIKYGYGETVPSDGSATAWLQGTLEKNQCP